MVEVKVKAVDSQSGMGADMIPGHQNMSYIKFVVFDREWVKAFLKI